MLLPWLSYLVVDIFRLPNLYVGLTKHGFRTHMRTQYSRLMVLKSCPDIILLRDSLWGIVCVTSVNFVSLITPLLPPHSVPSFLYKNPVMQITDCYRVQVFPRCS